MLKAFWRVAPSVRFSFLAICAAVVFFFAIALRSRTSAAVHARRFFFIFAIKPPFQERQFVSLTGVREKPTDSFSLEGNLICRWNLVAQVFSSQIFVAKNECCKKSASPHCLNC